MVKKIKKLFKERFEKFKKREKFFYLLSGVLSSIIAAFLWGLPPKFALLFSLIFLCGFFFIDDIIRIVKKVWKHLLNNKKSYILAIAIAILVVVIVIIWNSIDERNKLKEDERILKDIKYLETFGINFEGYEDRLVEISKESINYKLKLLDVVLNKANSSIENRIMHVLYHTLIGVSKENWSDVANHALKNFHRSNGKKIEPLFRKEYYNFSPRLNFQTEIIKKLKESEDPEFQNFLVLTLGDIGDDNNSSVPLNEIRKNSENLDLRKNIAEAFKRIGDRKILSAQPINTPITIEPPINSPVNINDGEDVKILIKIIKDSKNVDEQSNAVDALGGVNNKDAVEELINILKSSRYSYLHANASKALDKISQYAGTFLSDMLDLFASEKDNFEERLYLAIAILKINPLRPNLERIITKILPYPLAVDVRVKGKKGDYQRISDEEKFDTLKIVIKSVEEFARKVSAGKSVDFDGNMWKMLDWCEKYLNQK